LNWFDGRGDGIKMNPKTLDDVVIFAARLGHAMVATADSEGLPHIAVAGDLKRLDDRHIAVTDWFCAGTTSNLQVNKHIAIVAWDKSSDKGYQLLGRLTKLHGVAMLDGFPPRLDGKKEPPQVEREIVVRIDKILDFRHALHSDEEEA
jgi:hypothetical protein